MALNFYFPIGNLAILMQEGSICFFIEWHIEPFPIHQLISLVFHPYIFSGLYFKLFVQLILWSGNHYNIAILLHCDTGTSSTS